MIKTSFPLALCLLAFGPFPSLSAAAPTSAISLSGSGAMELSEAVKAVIQEGRALLKEGKAKEALAKFEQASTDSKQDPDAYIWVLRAWMEPEVNRRNDAFNEADRLQKEGVDTAGLDYVYGMGSLIRAQDVISAKGNPGMAFGDAVQYLQSALDRDAATYSDAWFFLAQSAWYMPELDRAIPAIAKAIELEPKSAMVRKLEGDIHFSKYKDLITNKRADEVVPKDHADKALAAFARASELTGDKKENASEQFAIWNQVGAVHAWTKDYARASEAFAESMGWAPGLMDYAGVLWPSVVQGEDMQAFNSSIESGIAKHKERFGEDAEGVATMLWWLGYGQMSGKEYEKSEESFNESAARNKAFANAWFYVGLNRYHRTDYVGACAHWLKYGEHDEAGLVQTISSGADTYVPMVEFAAAKVGEKGYSREGTLEDLVMVEKVNEVLSKAQPTRHDLFNNLGLLRRDIGGASWRASGGTNAKEVMQIFQESWSAYKTAIRLVPTDPGYLNDGAVILHYYLGSDLDEARDLYQRAEKEATKRIELESWKKMDKPEQVAAEEERIRTALRDAKDNLAKLDRGFGIGNRGPNAKKVEEKEGAEAGAPK